ncbi:MAG: hypothetical protein NWF03_07375 [Candidatus Bathyarchaeota archaeon]|nr:hypothetical protein [Candidatus Bathyarchaeota archaeon]
MTEKSDTKEDWRITLRLPKRDYYFIQKLVEDGEYVNSADAIRDAVKHFRVALEKQSPMQTRYVDAMWIFKEEIGQKDFLDWFAAHTSFMLPIHRYKGALHLFDDALVFYGKNTKTGQTEIDVIPFQNVDNLYFGFDDAYKRRETRGGFGHEAPLRIDYKEANKLKSLYCFLEFNRISRATKNQEWFRALQKLQGVTD